MGIDFGGGRVCFGSHTYDFKRVQVAPAEHTQLDIGPEGADDHRERCGRWLTTYFFDPCSCTCFMAGSLPAKLGGLSRLTHLSLSWNELSGKLVLCSFRSRVLLAVLALSRPLLWSSSGITSVVWSVPEGARHPVFLCRDYLPYEFVNSPPPGEQLKGYVDALEGMRMAHGTTGIYGVNCTCFASVGKCYVQGHKPGPTIDVSFDQDRVQTLQNATGSRGYADFFHDAWPNHISGWNLLGGGGALPGSGERGCRAHRGRELSCGSRKSASNGTLRTLYPCCPSLAVRTRPGPDEVQRRKTFSRYSWTEIMNWFMLCGLGSMCTRHGSLKNGRTKSPPRTSGGTTWQDRSRIGWETSPR